MFRDSSSSSLSMTDPLRLTRVPDHDEVRSFAALPALGRFSTALLDVSRDSAETSRSAGDSSPQVEKSSPQVERSSPQVDRVMMTRVYSESDSAAHEMTRITAHKLVDYSLSPICPSGSSITNMPHSFELETPRPIHRASTYIDPQSPLTASNVTGESHLTSPQRIKRYASPVIMRSTDEGESSKISHFETIDVTSGVDKSSETNGSLKPEPDDLNIKIETEPEVLKNTTGKTRREPMTLIIGETENESRSRVANSNGTKIAVSVIHQQLSSSVTSQKTLPLKTAQREMSGLVDELLTAPKSQTAKKQGPAAAPGYSSVKVEPK